jgi:SAM-dependent methyltransferase
LSSGDANRHTTTEVFNYYKCPQCDMMFLHPLPADERPFYAGGYDPIPGNLSQLRELAKPQKHRMDPVLKHKRSGRLLEIGPWIGIFSLNAKDAGFDVTAIEIDSECVTFLNRIVGIQAIQSSDPARAMETMSSQYDVIAFWHSLEHLKAPWHIVATAAQRLAPGGILVIGIPNIESYDFLALRSAWQHLDAPRHLSFYSPRGLQRVCEANGLRTLDLITNDPLSTELSLGAWRKRARSTVRVRVIRKLWGDFLFHRAMKRTHGHGSGLTAVFEKPEPGHQPRQETDVTNSPSSKLV